MKNPAVIIKKVYNSLKNVPGGKTIFSKMLSKMVPYSGSIKPHVEELREGYAEISIKDKRFVRNHLNSVHAIALVNLGELVSGLALTFTQPENVRGIVKRIEIDYLKKARGKITGISEVELPQITERTDFVVTANLFNPKKEQVAAVRVHWVLEPV